MLRAFLAAVNRWQPFLPKVQSDEPISQAEALKENAQSCDNISNAQQQSYENEQRENEDNDDAGLGFKEVKEEVPEHFRLAAEV